MGTGSRMMICTAEARVEGRRHSPSHHQQGDGRVRVQIESVLERSTLPSTTFHRHPHCTCVTQRAPNTGTSTYARKSWGGHPWVIWHRKVPPSGLWLCGSASTWQWLLRARKERRGLLVVTGTTGRTSCGTPERLRPSIHHPLHATAHSAARANHHGPHLCWQRSCTELSQQGPFHFPRPRQWWRYLFGVMGVCGFSSGSSLCVHKSVGFVISHSVLRVLFSRLG